MRTMRTGKQFQFYIVALIALPWLQKGDEVEYFNSI